MKPLEGIRVADFTWALAGPICTKILSDYGAEVIKVEGKTRPDSRRIAAPFKDFVPGLNRSGTYNPYNTGKLSLALNLGNPKGIEVARKLVSQSDIVVDNFAGGAMVRMGLGYDELKKVKSDIIMLSSCPMGQTGPYPTAPAIGTGMAAISGMNNLLGWPDRPPIPIGTYTDFIGPRFSTFAILAALDYRRRAGKGQYLDYSQYEGCVHFLAPLIFDYTFNNRIDTRAGNDCPQAAPHNAYRCSGKDRWCAIAVFNDIEWHNLCQAMGNPAWTKSERFATLLARKKNETELDKLIESWTGNLSAEEAMTLLQKAGVPAGVAQTSEDLLKRDPQLKHRGFFHEVDHPEVGKHHAARSPYIFSDIPVELKRSPLIGEHNEYVCKEILKLSDDEVAELIVQGALE